MNGCGPAPGLAKRRFPERARDIQAAADRPALLRALARFLAVGFWARHCFGTYGPLTRMSIAHEACQLAQESGAAKEVEVAEVAYMAAVLDDRMREFVAA